MAATMPAAAGKASRRSIVNPHRSHPLHVETSQPPRAANDERQTDHPGHLRDVVGLRNFVGQSNACTPHVNAKIDGAIPKLTMSARESNCLPNSVLVPVARATKPSHANRTDRHADGAPEASPDPWRRPSASPEWRKNRTADLQPSWRWATNKCHGGALNFRTSPIAGMDAGLFADVEDPCTGIGQGLVDGMVHAFARVAAQIVTHVRRYTAISPARSPLRRRAARLSQHLNVFRQPHIHAQAEANQPDAFTGRRMDRRKPSNTPRGAQPIRRSA